MAQSFEMPSITYIPITMSESIASTCCYAFVYNSSGMIQTQRTLNGGSIGATYGFSIYPKVAQMFNGNENIPKNHYTYFYPNVYDPNYYDATAMQHGRQGYWAKEVVASHPAGAVNPNRLWVVDMGDVYEAQVLPGSYVQLTVPYCDHVSQKCPFNQMVGSWNQHIGASSPHAMGGSQWWNPHPAVQFSS
ncbi:hypothetical protein AGMMS49992_18510 [Clostridia bacterium]|nr:hypothetical protein AGMMS49992_18510 [Clostridia bacterium]